MLGLPAGTIPTEADFNNLPRYAPRSATSEKEVPEVAAPYWLPILEEQGHLADCPLEDFAVTNDWVPLYTPESLVKHLPAALLAYGPPSK